ncbi:MAG: decaprenyl-phosphate phosphoribosyltransferase [Prevotella sp.]|uniref:decaprenyl-phosphate phosphoribosyltransferase n=1 Tax=Prevotella sp. TaxID=59823 RepID=UPI002A32E2FD|nr:decaprenyl-phosphate phosphoribosyltransferase [Prevotella sp.]MDD7317736.1 decaprenyl-phosphate phosphoribosyltransferase [Prevotellaceae bacterium]MDY4020651.1 decaprenyl-phosphate phosphoribosyltransferase [Prevotella sp.]
MKDIILLTRPKQWLKNVFVLLPVFFGGALADGKILLQALATFVAYSFVASSVYCFNDIVDLEADRMHSTKCLRPIASGRVSISRAYMLMALTFLAGMVMLLFVGGAWYKVASVLVGYYVLNLFYCARLKQFAVIDVCVVAFGFVLRLLAGSLATGIPLSKWIVMMTFLLALFLSFAKRRDDVVRMEQTGIAPRKNTNRYNLTFINQAITILASVTLVCYIMYTVSPEVEARTGSRYIYLTTVFVLLGLLRYIQITVVDKRSEDPTKIIFTDRFLQLVILAWAAMFFIAIYLL